MSLRLDKDRPIIQRALSLMRMPGYQDRLREKMIFFLEKRVETLTHEIIGLLQDRKRVVRILEEMKRNH